MLGKKHALWDGQAGLRWHGLSFYTAVAPSPLANIHHHLCLLLAVFCVSPTSLSSWIHPCLIPSLFLLQNFCEVCWFCDWEFLLKSGIDPTERCYCGGDVIAGMATLISPSLPSFLPFLLSIFQVQPIHGNFRPGAPQGLDHAVCIPKLSL